MRYGSVCSGVEAATVAWHPLGWEPQWFAEIEKFPSAVLAHHYPTVPNLGDMTKLMENPTFDERPIDLLVGGTPCQSFSVAGLRKGLSDPRGNLALVYLALAARKRPRWVVWENVPGVLSSNGGRDFGDALWHYKEAVAFAAAMTTAAPLVKQLCEALEASAKAMEANVDERLHNYRCSNLIVPKWLLEQKEQVAVFRQPLVEATAWLAKQEGSK